MVVEVQALSPAAQAQESVRVTDKYSGACYSITEQSVP
jgi:hypothetical protein